MKDKRGCNDCYLRRFDNMEQQKTQIRTEVESDADQ